MAIGVFGLQVAYRLKRLEVMSTANTHGWFGGGYIPTPASLSTVDRIDFSNDSVTASVRGPLSLARYNSAATGNSNYGWFGGGRFESLAVPLLIVSTVDRIDFSNDSSIALIRGSLSSVKQIATATGNSNYGWFGGGANATPAILSTVDRIDFSNDSSTVSVRGPLSSARYTRATGNSNYGWFGGGGTGTLSTVDRIDFSNDSATASPRGSLSLARRLLSATGNSNYGWWSGGITPTEVSTVDRIDFSNDSSTASVRGPLNLTRYNSAATGNSNYGWFGGGNTPTLISAVDRINFSNDLATASVRGSLSLARRNSAATSGQAKGPAIKLQKAGSYGWFGGGLNPGPTTVSTVNRIDFSNDSSTASVRGSLSLARTSSTATGNSNYGWFGGGYPVTFGTSRVDRIDFSSDSVTASVRGPLSSARYSMGATGNSNYGWYAGGTVQPSPALPPVYQSTVDRINFSNDSIAASPRSQLSRAKGFLRATGNSNYGWYAGGFTNTPTPATFLTVERIDFSNDSATPSPRGPLSLARNTLAATGNSNYGWYGGGGSPGGVSRVDRINFSNDSATASVRGPLSLARNNLAATGNSNYGWYAGGSSGAAPFASYSRIDRIDFSNDSATASIRGPLSSARYVSAATSNTTR